MAGIDISIDVGELNRLAVALGDAGAKAVPAASAAVRKVAFGIEADAKGFAPVDTGNLRNSISTDARGLEAEIGPTASYGIFVELGTSVMAPQAFLGPAFDRRAPELVEALAAIADLFD